MNNPLPVLGFRMVFLVSINLLETSPKFSVYLERNEISEWNIDLSQLTRLGFINLENNPIPTSEQTKIKKLLPKGCEVKFSPFIEVEEEK
jgi:hypothetical protein